MRERDILLQKGSFSAAGYPQPYVKGRYHACISHICYTKSDQPDLHPAAGRSDCSSDAHSRFDRQALPIKDSPVRVRILEVDDTHIEQYGIVKTGSQRLSLEVLSGAFKGQKVSGVNMLMGKMEFDTIYLPGDRALGTLYTDADGDLSSITLTGYYRLDAELILLGIFALFLLLFAGITGLKALVSFLFSGVMIWKVMLPLFLAGYDPVFVSLSVVVAVSAVILFLVGDLSQKGAAAFLGTVAGVLITCSTAIIFGSAFRISGAVKPFAETLLYSGYPHLDLTKIFLAGIFLAASGAVMDISMDVASAMEEVQLHQRGISRKDLILSGFRVGRSVVGTMTTTLLLAYSSSYMGLLMVFMAQGTPPAQIFNLSYVAAEILNTMAGSFGLVVTAPATAIIAGILYTRKHPAPAEKTADGSAPAALEP